MAGIASELLNKKADKTDLELKADKTYVDEKISESKGYAFPDYSKKTIVKAVGVDYNGTGYTAESDGWFWIQYGNSADIISYGNILSVCAYIDEKYITTAWISQGSSQNAGGNYEVSFPIRKGSTLTLNYDAKGSVAGYKAVDITFIPCS